MSSSHIDSPLCEHGLPTILLTTKKPGENLGRYVRLNLMQENMVLGVLNFTAASSTNALEVEQVEMKNVNSLVSFAGRFIPILRCMITLFLEWEPSTPRTPRSGQPSSQPRHLDESPMTPSQSLKRTVSFADLQVGNSSGRSPKRVHTGNGGFSASGSPAPSQGESSSGQYHFGSITQAFHTEY